MQLIWLRSDLRLRRQHRPELPPAKRGPTAAVYLISRRAVAGP
jgi:hypothetical protein